MDILEELRKITKAEEKEQLLENISDEELNTLFDKYFIPYKETFEELS